MTAQRDPSVQEDTVRDLASRKGYQLRRTDHSPGLWHIVDLAIDDKAYAFSFTKPHSFTLQEIEELLHRKPDAVRS